MLNGGWGKRKQTHDPWRGNKRQVLFTNFPILNILSVIVLVLGLNPGILQITLRLQSVSRWG